MSYENVPKNADETAVLVESTIVSPLNTAGDAVKVEGPNLASGSDSVSAVITSPLNSEATAVLVEQVAKATVNPAVLPEFTSTATATTTIATAVASQDRDIVLTDAAGFSVGDRVIPDGYPGIRKLPIIVAITGNTITLDKLIDGTYAVGTSIEAVPVELNVVGSAASPIIFSAGPSAGEVWRITRFLIAMTHGTSGDLGLFGDLDELTYGVQGRVYKNGVYTTIVNWKTNGDMANSMYDVSFDARSGGGGDYGTRGRFTITNTGTELELIGDNGDEVQLVIQDDLSGLDTFEIAAQGYSKL